MKNTITKSIQFKVNVVFIAVTLVIAIIFNLYNYATIKSEKTDELEHLSSFTSERLAKSFVAPLWNMETDKLKDAINFEMAEKNILAIVVLGAEKKTIVAGAKRNRDWKTVDAGSSFSSDAMMVEKEIVGEGEKLGYMRLYLTDRFIKAAIRGSVTGSIISYLLLAVVLILTLYFLLRTLVFKPVHDVIGLTTSLNEGNLSVRVEAKNQEDEVGVMIGTINDFATNLQKTIQQTNIVMKAVAQGNLTDQVTTDLRGDLNELKTSINDSINMLGKTISEVVRASEAVKQGATEITTSATTLANGTTQQAAAIEEISSSIGEFSSQTKANNDNASEAQELSIKTLEIVERGNNQMASMLTSINEISQTSSEVSKVIKVIDEIAFQTNLLALNAAVEAARAGSYGKGFAVVAEEVRNLASRSAEAAKNTTELIEASLKEVEKGVQNADQTAAVLGEISEAIGKNNDLVKEISDASQEQNTGIAEINRGLSQVNDIVQQNSAISEETASSSDELANQAIRLQELMKRFQLPQDTMSPTRPAIQKAPAVEVKKVAPKPVQQPALKYQPEKAKDSAPRKQLILDDDDFGKY